MKGKKKICFQTYLSIYPKTKSLKKNKQIEEKTSHTTTAFRNLTGCFTSFLGFNFPNQGSQSLSFIQLNLWHELQYVVQFMHNSKNYANANKNLSLSG